MYINRLHEVLVPHWVKPEKIKCIKFLWVINLLCLGNITVKVHCKDEIKIRWITGKIVSWESFINLNIWRRKIFNKLMCGFLECSMLVDDHKGFADS